MSQTRLSTTDILTCLFTDPEKKTKYRESSKEALTARHLTKRVFDNFPCLLFEDDMISLCEKFKKILDEVEPQEFESGHFQLVRDKDVDIIHAWVNEVAGFASQEMLDSRGYIKEEIRHLLTWEKELSQIQVCDVLCAYVSSIHQAVIDRLTSELLQDVKKIASFKAVIDLIGSRQYVVWTLDVLKEKNLIFNPRALDNADWSHLIAILHLPFDNPKVSAGIGIGIAAVTLFGMGLTLFQKFNHVAAAPAVQPEMSHNLLSRK